MTRDARFYFANLGADVARCIKAAEEKSDERYADSVVRAYDTLEYLHSRPEAYEEGLLLLRGLAYTKGDEKRRATFSHQLTNMIADIYHPLG